MNAKKYIKWFLLSIAVLVLVACGGNSHVAKELAIDKLEKYAQNGGVSPDISVYVTAGVTGVDSGNIYGINAIVAGLTASDVDTTEKLQQALAGMLREVLPAGVSYEEYYRKKRVERQYTRDDVNNIVTDHTTRLQWQDDVNVSVVTKQWVTTANHNNGSYSDTSGYTAATYCENMTLGSYTNWRLPSIDELKYIMDKDKHNPAIDTSVFKNVISNGYWSSTTVSGHLGDAWNVNLRNGSDHIYAKSGSYYVRCVRNG